VKATTAEDRADGEFLARGAGDAKRNETMLAVVGMETGFETDQLAVISEQDILGDRLVRPRKATPQARQLHLRSPRSRRRRSSSSMSITASAVSSGCRRSRRRRAA
jgi:transcription-repair coupling factor (superfamily II helicase)